MISTCFVAVLGFLLAVQDKPDDRFLRKDSTLRGELKDLEFRLQMMETKLRARAKLPPLSESITQGAQTEPDLMGRIEEGFDDGVTALLTISILPWKDEKTVVYVDAGAERSYLDLSRRERREFKGLVVYVWLREGSEDHAARAVFGKEGPYAEWEKAGRERIEAIRRDIASAVDKRREEEAGPLYEAAELRIREADIKSENRKLLKDLKASGAKGPYGYVRATDAERGTITVAFYEDRKPVERTWPLAAGSLIVFERYRKAALSDLGTGCRIHTWFVDADRKALSVVEGFGGSVGGSKGRLGTIDFKRRLVTIPPGDREKHPGTYVIAEDAQIQIDGREAALSELDPKKPIRLQLSSDMKTAIAVRQGGGRR